MVYSTDKPVAIQSQQWLANALLELMKEKPYHQITISEENLELALAFNAGGMWNLLMKWIDTGFVYSYSDLVKAFEEISAFNFKSNE